MSSATVEAHFELYVLRQGRWVLESCCSDEADARHEVQRLSRAAGVRGARLVRELKFLGADQSVATVLVDTTQAENGDARRAAAPAKEAPAAPRSAVLGKTGARPRREPAEVVARDRATTVLIAGVIVTSLLLAGAVVAFVFSV